jgi:hypothetical protein
MSKTGVITKVSEIKAAIQRLPTQQRKSLIRWLEETEEAEWDREIARDASKGNLKDLLDEVDADIAAGKLYRMP